MPGFVQGMAPPPNEALNLLRLAELNKIPLLFLESLVNLRKHTWLGQQLSRYRDRQRRTLALTADVSSLLEAAGIRYVIFKTLKPFPYTPADIDVLLRSSSDLAGAAYVLGKRNLSPLESDLYGLTMFSLDYGLNVDLTTELAVSGFIYLDKSLLFDGQKRVHCSGVQTLKPHADLVTLAAHSMYKEQTYALSDYYTFALSSQYHQRALELAQAAHARFALEAALKLTEDITVSAFASDNELMPTRMPSVTTAKTGGMMEACKALELPMRYPIPMLIRGLSQKIIGDPVSRNSLPKALESSLRPRFINKLSRHFTRRTY